MEKPAKKMGRPRADANALAMPSLKEPTKEVVNQGRRAGQPKSSRSPLSESEIRLGGRPISSPLENKRESGGHKKEGSDFGRIQSVPESSGNQWRIRIVNQEHGPFRTIQAALEEALNGDIISISPGYYAEQLMIERDNVRIVGKVRDGGEVVMECTPEKWVFQANRDAGNCRLENLTFRSSAAAEQESNVVSGAKAGIAALKAKVKGGMFALARAEKDMVHHDKKQGGYAAIVESGRVTFLNCTFAGPCGGVLITGAGAESLIFGCKFTAVPAGPAAVQIEQRSRARVRKCIFENCLGMGIQAVNSEFTIDENTFSDMHNYSIQIALNATGNIRENSFVKGRKASIAVSGNSAPLIANNRFSQAYATGVFVFDTGLLLYCCFTAALLLLCCCVAAAVLEQKLLSSLRNGCVFM